VSLHRTDRHLDTYDQELMTAVVQRAEMAGKQVYSLIVPTQTTGLCSLTTAKDSRCRSW